MSNWPATPARRVLAARLRIGWQIKRERGSHRTLAREGWPDYTWAFHDSVEIGPRMLARIGTHTGLRSAVRRVFCSPRTTETARR